MEQIPDAPWIRDAEMYGPPGMQEEDIYCPVCNEENPDWLFIVDGDCIGCECCVNKVDAYEWIMKKRSA